MSNWATDEVRSLLLEEIDVRYGRYRTRLMGVTPINVLTITADYAQGSSGGPILNEHGAVVGMVCQTLTISDDNDESQMTWKFSRPSSSILAILEGSPTALKQ